MDKLLLSNLYTPRYISHVWIILLLSQVVLLGENYETYNLQGYRVYASVCATAEYNVHRVKKKQKNIPLV